MAYTGEQQHQPEKDGHEVSTHLARCIITRPNQGYLFFPRIGRSWNCLWMNFVLELFQSSAFVFKPAEVGTPLNEDEEKV